MIMLLAGCGLDYESPPVTDRAAQSVTGRNQLALNQLALNQLALNQLALNQLALNRLSNQVFLNTTPGGLHTTEDGREFLQYVAQCALAEGDVLTFDHDSVTYQYPGRLNLAPDWELYPLDAGEIDLVSACLIASVNAYDIAVQISARMDGVLGASASERRDYAVYEGTFYGDGSDAHNPKYYSCQGHRDVVALANSSDRHDRACADSSPDCGVAFQGRCRDVCASYSDDLGWTDCTGGGDTYAYTISVYLHADSLHNDYCGSNSYCCRTIGAGAQGVIDCAQSSMCYATCGTSATCILDGNYIDSFDGLVRDGAIADVDCAGTDDCEVTCNANSDCDIECSDTLDCSDVECRSGAACLLNCRGSGSCGFSVCPGGATACGNGVIACGRPCP